MKNLNFHRFKALNVILILLLCSNADVEAQNTNWPQFRGINLSGHAHEKARPPIQFGPNHNLLWKTDLPIGHSSPCIWRDYIFLTGYIKDKMELQTICLDRQSGKIKWQQSVFPEKLENYHAISNAAVATPTCDGERVYVYFGSYGLLCYSMEGVLVWEKRMPIPRVWYGSSTSPVVTEDFLIFCQDFHRNSYLRAFNKVNGSAVWEVQLPTAHQQHHNSTSYSTPLIMNKQIVLHRVYEISAYDINDGSQLWHLPAPSSGVSSPIFHQDVIYIGTWQEMGEKDRVGEFPNFIAMIKKNDTNGDSLISKEEIPDKMLIFSRPEMEENSWYWKNAFGMIDKNKNGTIDEKEWMDTVNLFKLVYAESGLIALKPSGNGELPASQVLWKIAEKVPEVPSPIFCNGCVYMIKNGGIITCVEARKGKVLFCEKLGVAGPYIASPIVANGHIYVPSCNGVVTVIKAGKKLEILAQNDLNDKIYASPAVIDSVLYIRTLNSLYTFTSRQGID